MKNAQINLYSFNELSETAKQRAIYEHQSFLDFMPIEYENEEGEMINEWHEHSEEETIESIEINEYLFFADGKMANVTRFCGKHPKAGQSILVFAGQKYAI